MLIFRGLCRSEQSVRHLRLLWLLAIFQFLRWEDIPSPKQAVGPPFVACPWLPIRHIFSHLHIWYQRWHIWYSDWARVDQRVPRTSCGIHRCPKILIFKTDQRLYVVKNMCVCIHMYLTAYRLVMHYRYCQIALRMKHFYTNRESCEVLTGHLSLGLIPGGDWANMWHWTERFRIFL